MLMRELHGQRVAIFLVMGISYQSVLRKIAGHGLDVRAMESESVEARRRAAG